MEPSGPGCFLFGKAFKYKFNFFNRDRSSQGYILLLLFLRDYIDSFFQNWMQLIYNVSFWYTVEWLRLYIDRYIDMCLCLVTSVLSDFAIYGLLPTRLLCPWDSLGKNTGVGCHALFQGIFLTQGLNLCLLYCRWILYHWDTREAMYINIYICVCVYIYISIYIYFQILSHDRLL